MKILAKLREVETQNTKSLGINRARTGCGTPLGQAQ